MDSLNTRCFFVGVSHLVMAFYKLNSVIRMDRIHISQGEAARGPMLHWVRLENERIVEYHISAPTEWRRRAGRCGYLKMKRHCDCRPRWLDAIDPCVAYELRLH